MISFPMYTAGLTFVTFLCDHDGQLRDSNFTTHRPMGFDLLTDDEYAVVFNLTYRSSIMFGHPYPSLRYKSKSIRKTPAWSPVAVPVGRCVFLSRLLSSAFHPYISVLIFCPSTHASSCEAGCFLCQVGRYRSTYFTHDGFDNALALTGEDP